MKFFKMILVLLTLMFAVVGCNNNKEHYDGLDEFRNTGNVVDITYEELDIMLSNQKSFIFFLRQKGCSSCEMFYSVVKEFLNENQDKLIYILDYDGIQAVDQITLNSFYQDVLGKDYYNKYNYDINYLYTPTIAKVINGRFIDAEIGYIDKIKLTNFYQANFQELEFYYDYSRKTSNKESFFLFVSTNFEQEYCDLLRNYYKINKSKCGYYLHLDYFDEDYLTRLLNRANYFIDEDNQLEELPEYFFLEYQEGSIVNYLEGKCDYSKIDELYSFE